MKGRNQLLQGFSGSFENITVVRAADGDTIIRGKITHMSNPNSAEQQKVRGRFRDITRRAVLLKDFLRTHFEKKRTGVSSYASFISKNMLRVDEQLIVKLEAEAALDFYTNGILSDSGLVVDQMTTLIIDDNSISFSASWIYHENGSTQKGTDQLLILSFDMKNGDWNVLETGVNRASESVNTNVVTWPQGDTIIVPFFFNNTETLSSTSSASLRRAANGAIEFL